MKKIILLLNFLVISSVFMHSRTLTVTVVDFDIDIPLEGVSLDFKNVEQQLVTGPDGTVTLEVEDSLDRLMIFGSLVGYESLEMLVTNITDQLTVYMSISSVVEGTELVIEEESAGTTDEELGVSTVLSNEELRSTSEVGIIEDVISSIKTLPGVSFTGNFNTFLSIRGGSPTELTTVLDGFIIRFPFHWGGAYSVFNPNTISSVKFSTGIFSVKHGLAISGLLELETIKPDDGFKFEFGGGTTTVEALLQTPVGIKNAGLFIGSRITFLDLAAVTYEGLRQANAIPDPGLTFAINPYIRDAYFKWYHQPNKRFEWYINGLFASDGTGIKFEDPNIDPSTDVVNRFDAVFQNYDVVTVAGIKALPVDRLFIHAMAGYEFLLTRVSGSNFEFGTREYSDDFKTQYAAFLASIGNPTSYEIGPNESSFIQDSILHSLQTRVDFDITLHERVLLSTGTGVILDFLNFGAQGSFYLAQLDVTDDPTQALSYTRGEAQVESQDKRILKSFVYLNTKVDFVPNIFWMNAGVRLDHFLLWTDNFRVNTYPVVGPRIALNFQPIREVKPIKSLTFSLGTGLFSKVPLAEIAINDQFQIPDFDLLIPQTLITVLGTQVEFDNGIRIKLEGYHKFYFNQVYLTTEFNISSFNFADINLNTNGIGHAGGFDVLIQRRISRFIDGWISYSFIYSKFLNPDKGSSANIALGSTGAALTGQWYYPSYHRFHTLNLVINIKPTPWMTITPTFSLASGVPVSEFGETQSFPAKLDNGQYAEWYVTSSRYSDTLRSDISMPLDIKVSFHSYFKRIKLRMEAYIAVEDIFAPLYTPEGGVTTNRFTGESQPSSESPLNIPFPVPSIGVKLNF
jgi:hypothetical protein